MVSSLGRFHAFNRKIVSQKSGVFGRKLLSDPCQGLQRRKGDPSWGKLWRSEVQTEYEHASSRTSIVLFVVRGYTMPC